MNLKSSKAVVAAFSVFCIVSLFWSVYRDTELEKQYPVDLRNRVVGSRLQMDGMSPYFYHWRYRMDSGIMTLVTATTT
jgi:hypothetical protein